MVEATNQTSDPTPEIDLEKIRKKVQQLLNLTVENGATEAEAANALDKATALLEKYNLTMDTINDIDAAERKLVEEGFQDYTCKWERILIYSIAKFNMCDTLRDGQKMCIFGRTINVMAARLMYAWIVPQIYKFYNEAVGDRTVLRARADWRTDFYLGAAHRIGTRLKELQEARHVVQNDCKAIVLVRSAEATQYRDQLYPDAVNSKNRRRRVTRGYEHGRIAGDKISLGDSKPIGQHFHQLEV